MSKAASAVKASPGKEPTLLKRGKRFVVEKLADRREDSKLRVEVINNEKKPRKITFNVEKNLLLIEVKTMLFDRIKEIQRSPGNVIGFQSQKGDFAFDYRMQMGIGNLQNDLELKCFYIESQKGLQKYKICCCLAIGGFSKVFLVRSKGDGKFYAAKFIDKSKKQLMNYDLLQNEREISLKLNSPFLVRTYEFIQTEQFSIFIMEYCPGGQLFYLLKHVKYMSEVEARACFIQILLGIEYLHNAGYMYRDMKPQNVLLDCYGFLKIADFGLAKLHSSKSFSFCGSVEYMAPEILKGRGHEKYVDFYCLGALLYEMLIGHPPFYDSRCTSDQTKRKILFDEIQFPPEMLSEGAKDLIRRLTCKNEKERLGFYGGCKQIMAHPWVGKINRKVFEERKFTAPFPVDLSKLNFDPEEIGQSQRIFQERINYAIEKNLPEIENRKSLLQNHKKSKSHSQKFLLKKPVSPYRNRSLLTCSQSKSLKSPYEHTLKKSGSLKKTKTQKNEEPSRFLAKKFIENIRWTEESQDGRKQNKMVKVASKLRKKCRVVPFMTTVDTQGSPFKKRFHKQRVDSQEKRAGKHPYFSHYRF